MSDILFAYGPLGDELVRSRLFGNAGLRAAPARLRGFALVEANGWPAPRLGACLGAGAVPGALFAMPGRAKAEALAARLGCVPIKGIPLTG